MKSNSVLLLFHVKLLLLFLLPIALFSQHSTTTIVEVKPLPPTSTNNAEINSFLGSYRELDNASPQVKEWYYWTNYSRLHPKAFWDSIIVPILKVYPNLNTRFAASLKIDLYQAQSLSPIKPNVKLLRTSQAHAIDLARNSPGRLSHNSTNGDAFEKRIFSAGIQKCAAENLSLGPFNTVFALMLLYIDEGLPDVGHRRNLLSPYYAELGVGVAKTRGNAVVVVQDFACDQSR